MRPNWLTTRETFLHHISGGVGMGMGVSCPPPPPPGSAEPHLITHSNPGARPGSMWVNGALLRYISNDGSQYAETGTSQPPAPGGRPGSIWQESDDIHYIDESGIHRSISKTSAGARPGPAIVGSIWLDPNDVNQNHQIKWAASSNLYSWWNGL